MLVEAQRSVETSAKWLSLDTNKGAPFTMTVPLSDTSLVPGIKDKSLIAPYSRWTIGRKSNTNYTVGSGFEGHLCAYAPREMLDILTELQNSAYHIMRCDVSAKTIAAFLEDPSIQIGKSFLDAGANAFVGVLAKARAVRGMVEQEGCYYAPDGTRRDVDEVRRNRVRDYRAFVFNAPLVVD